uniref:Uncharacterized protein n=1 Tax=Anguilla anguilla TaxID=7936 RepID=A0A0E9W900_ANGAN
MKSFEYSFLNKKENKFCIRQLTPEEVSS